MHILTLWTAMLVHPSHGMAMKHQKAQITDNGTALLFLSTEGRGGGAFILIYKVLESLTLKEAFPYGIDCP